MSMTFKKAIKSQAKLRLAIFGPAGSGKTYTSLRIATGMGNKIAFIDTEKGSASKYADKFNFDVLELEKMSIDDYVDAINIANENGYDVLIIDSLTHAWQELLEDIDKLANTKFKGNTWRAWSEGTPKQKELISAILRYNGHIIATMRSKTEWTTEATDKGVKPIRVGLAPEQGKGIEYEFDMLMEITPDHHATIIKDRTGKFQDKIITKPDEKFGKELMNWLNSGEVPNKTNEEPKEEAKKEDTQKKIETKEPEGKISIEHQFDLENLMMSLSMYELPEGALEKTREIAVSKIKKGTFTKEWIEEMKGRCSNYGYKQEYLAPVDEVDKLLEEANKRKIIDEPLTVLLLSIKDSKKILIHQFNSLKEEILKCELKDPPAPEIEDDIDIEPNFDFPETQEVKKEEGVLV